MGESVPEVAKFNSWVSILNGFSGIGPKKDLESHGIPVVRDLPGVGSNLSD